MNTRLTSELQSSISLHAGAGEILGALDRHAIISITDRAGRIVFCNEKFVEISGYSRDVLIGKNHNLLNSGLHRPEFFKEMWATIAAGRNWEGDIRNRRKDGSHYWVRSTIAPLLGDDGRPEKYLSIRTDVTSIKKAEIAYQSILSVDNIGNRVFVVWPETLELIFLNKTALSDFGLDTNDLAGLKLSDLNRLGDYHHAVFEEEAFRKIILQLLNGAQTKVTYEDTDKDGHPIEVRIELVTPENDRPRLVIVFRDISERKAAERAILRFKATLNKSRNEVYMFRPDNLRFFYVNEEATASLGYSNEELLEMGPLDIKPELDRESCLEIVDTLLSGQQSTAVFETVHRSKDGQERPVEVMLQLMQDDEIGPFCVAIVRDLTEKRAGEAENRWLRSMLDLMLAEIYVYDPVDLRFHYINYAGQKRFGWSESDYTVRTMADGSPQFDKERHLKRISALVEGAQASHVFETKDPDGRPIEVTEQAFFVDGFGTKIVAIVRDITERKVAEKRKDEFVSTVSHELRTPLTSIAAVLDLLRASPAGLDPAKHNRLLAIAGKNCDLLLNQINDILDSVGLETGQIEFGLEKIDLNSFLVEAVEINERFGDQYEVRFNRASDISQAYVMADSRRLMQVMANLMSNAAKFSKSGGEVEVRLFREQDDLCISVTDKGCGIALDDQQRVFGRFTQVDSSDTRAKGGTGLGLSISKSIVEKLGGSIGLTSEIGKGTTVKIKLPDAAT